MRLAVPDIKGGYHQFWIEDAGEVALESFQQALLSAARNYDALASHGLYGLQDLKCTKYGFNVWQGVEDVALYLIYILHLLGGGGTSPLSLGKDVDGALAGAPLVHVHILVRHDKVVGLHGTHPCFGMVLHAVEEHAVHVEKESADVLPAKRGNINKGRAFRPPFTCIRCI